MTVLLVDDDPEIRLIVSYLLQAAGHTVLQAQDGAAAGALLNEHDVDLMLMDVMLGTEDGIDVAAHLLQTPVAPAALIFLTGAARADQVARMQATPALGIVQKPFDPDTFTSTIERLLRDGRA